MLNLRASSTLEQFESKVRGGSIASGSAIQILGLGDCNEILQSLDCRIRPHHRDLRNEAHDRRGLQVSLQLIRRLGKQRDVGGMRNGGSEISVSVRLRFRDRIGTDHAVSACPVLDYDRLFPCLVELLGDIPRHDVRRSSCGKRDNDSYQFPWIGCALRECC